MSETKRPLNVFLCHAHDDKAKTRELYRYLRKRGIQPWLDAEDLVGGQDWRVEIPKAIKASEAIIICLSKNSINREGFVQAEISFALEKALNIPQGRIFIIPVRFEECEVPSSLERFHWVDLFEEDGFPKLMKSLKTRASQLGRVPVPVPQPDDSTSLLSSQLGYQEPDKEPDQKSDQEPDQQSDQKSDQKPDQKPDQEPDQKSDQKLIEVKAETTGAAQPVDKVDVPKRSAVWLKKWADGFSHWKLWVAEKKRNTSSFFAGVQKSRLPKSRVLLIPSFVLLFSVLGFVLYNQTNSPTFFFSGISDGEYNVYSYDGDNVNKITETTGGTRNWSPSKSFGGVLYFVSNRDGKIEIYSIDGDAKVLRITSTPGDAESWAPSVGLDGNLYFTSDRDGKEEIYRINGKGDVSRVTDTPGKAKSWAPSAGLDGNLYFTSDRDGKTEIYKINSEGNVSRVTSTPGNARSWSPSIGLDGNLYFTSDRDGKAEIYRINSDGNASRVTSTPGIHESWAPIMNGGNMYFTSNRSGRNQVYLLNAQTTAISEIESGTNKFIGQFSIYK